MPLLIKIGEGRYRSAHSLVVNRADGSVMLEVPAGEFEMGDGEESDCPKHRVKLGRYWIGIYCVTNGQYERFVRESGHGAPNNQKWNQEGLKNHPVVEVSWEDAVAYAKWAGCVLASEAQWEKAARGVKGLKYPWGSEWEEKRCRNSKNRGAEETCEVWKYGSGVSGYGTYNQSGNVWEWCQDWYGEKYYTEGAKENPTGPGTGSRRVFRGGGWRLDDPSCFRGARRFEDDPSGRRVGLGFRLARTE